MPLSLSSLGLYFIIVCRLAQCSKLWALCSSINNIQKKKYKWKTKNLVIKSTLRVKHNNEMANKDPSLNKIIKYSNKGFFCGLMFRMMVML